MLILNTSNELIFNNKVITLQDDIHIKKIYGRIYFTNKCTAHNFKYIDTPNSFSMTDIIDIDVCINNGLITWIFITDSSKVYTSSELCIHTWDSPMYYNVDNFNICNVKKIYFVSESYIFYISTHNDLLCYSKTDRSTLLIDSNVNLFLQYEGRKNFCSKKTRIVYHKNDGCAYIATLKYPNFNIIKQHAMSIIPLKCAKSIAIDVDGRVHTILKSTSVDCDFLTKIDSRFVGYTCDDITVCYHNGIHAIVLHTTDNKFVSVDTGLVIADDCITERKTFGKRVNHT